MKKALLLLFAIGLIIGVAQLFLVRNITKRNVEYIDTNHPICLSIDPECGACLYTIKNGYCYSPPYTQKFRGFPFTAGSYGRDSRTDITAKVKLNVAIWALGLPALGCAFIKAKNGSMRKVSKRRRSKSSKR